VVADIVVLTAAAGVRAAGAEAGAVVVGGAPRRLAAPGVVLRLDGAPPRLGLEGIDVNVVPAAMRGELDFEAALISRVALLKSLPTSVLERCYAERVRLNPGARMLVRTMVAQGAETALVSGGFTFFSERVAEAAGFSWHQANVLEARDGVLTGEVARPILGRAAKLAALCRIAAGDGIDPQAVLAVGDGANDTDMVQAAGLGVAYHAKPTLEAVAGARLRHSDLTALLVLQGIPETEWQE
jgi:phosphoserine phosphatase